MSFRVDRLCGSAGGGPCLDAAVEVGDVAVAELVECDDPERGATSCGAVEDRASVRLEVGDMERVGGVGRELQQSARDV